MRSENGWWVNLQECGRMLTDAESLQDRSVFESDICIVGAGVAGLLLADSLSEQNLRIHVLEGGGSVLEDRSQNLYQVQHEQLIHDGATNGRFRVYGGSSTRWGGQLLPFSSEVFNKRPWRSAESWPISPADIYRYEVAVHNIMGVNDLPFFDDSDNELNFRELNELVPQVRARFSKWTPFRRRNLRNTLGKKIEKKPNARLFLHANVTEIRLEPKGERVASLLVKDYQGRKFEFKARYFVLAASTIEVVRLLLNSKQCSQSGIANKHGLVGKKIHDHLSLTVGEIVYGGHKDWEKRFAPWYRRKTLHTPKLEASADLIEQNQWNDVMLHFMFDTSMSHFESLRNLLQSMQRRQFDYRGMTKALKSIPHFSDFIRVGYGAMCKNRRLLPENSKIILRVDAEQLPVDSNYIALSDSRDALGMPIAKLNWNIGQNELRTLSEFYRYCKQNWKDEFGIVQWVEFKDLAEIKKGVVDVFHLMGGTQMGTDESRSVVDGNLKVHGIENLYVSSCSVYPAGGTSNPTYTLMCLCLRLAEQLKALLR